MEEIEINHTHKKRKMQETEKNQKERKNYMI